MGGKSKKPAVSTRTEVSTEPAPCDSCACVCGVCVYVCVCVCVGVCVGVGACVELLSNTLQRAKKQNCVHVQCMEASITTVPSALRVNLTTESSCVSQDWNISKKLSLCR